jgi:DNA-binding transcriptional MerR regulator
MSVAKRKRAKAQPEVVIPEKIYFRIGEVSELASLPTYVLRFWETEFPQLKPTKSSTGQRMYRRKDVEYVMRIRRLLYEDGFTIAGAREKLREEVRSHRTPSQTLVAVPQPVMKNEVVHERVKDQATLPFLAPNPAAATKQELLRVRQELRAMLDLLS